MQNPSAGNCGGPNRAYAPKVEGRVAPENNRAGHFSAASRSLGSDETRLSCRTRSSRALLAYLFVHRARGRNRAKKLATLLWGSHFRAPGPAETCAKALFRLAPRAPGRGCPHRRRRKDISLAPGLLDCDVPRLEGADPARQPGLSLAAAVDLYKGRLFFSDCGHIGGGALGRLAGRRTAAGWRVWRLDALVRLAENELAAG